MLKTGFNNYLSGNTHFINSAFGLVLLAMGTQFYFNLKGNMKALPDRRGLLPEVSIKTIQSDGDRQTV